MPKVQILAQTQPFKIREYNQSDCNIYCHEKTQCNRYSLCRTEFYKIFTNVSRDFKNSYKLVAYDKHIKDSFCVTNGKNNILITIGCKKDMFLYYHLRKRALKLLKNNINVYVRLEKVKRSQ